jgi:hypothetical protein
MLAYRLYFRPLIMCDGCFEQGDRSMASPRREPFGLCQRGCGHRGRASPSGRAGDYRRHAPSYVMLAGRALRVPEPVLGRAGAAAGP